MCLSVCRGGEWSSWDPVAAGPLDVMTGPRRRATFRSQRVRPPPACLDTPASTGCDVQRGVCGLVALIGWTCLLPGLFAPVADLVGVVRQRVCKNRTGRWSARRVRFAMRTLLNGPAASPKFCTCAIAVPNPWVRPTPGQLFQRPTRATRTWTLDGPRGVIAPPMSLRALKSGFITCLSTA